MTSIKDLETQIEGAEDALAFAKGELADLKTRLRELKEQETDKEPESLFGRWATHKERGRVLIISDRPDCTNTVATIVKGVATESMFWADIDNLTLDPATLNTTEDFEKAPVGTIVEATEYPHDVAVKIEDGWHRARGRYAIAAGYMPTCRVIRWGENK